MSLDPETVGLVLGAFTAAGGAIGYARTGSVPSIAAGVTVGALYTISALRLRNKAPYGLELGLLASLVLAGSSIPRVVKLGPKPVPVMLTLCALTGFASYGLAWKNRAA